MPGTFLDTYSTDWCLDGHVSDLGFGMWLVVPEWGGNRRDFLIAAGRLELAKPLGQAVWGHDRCANLVGAYSQSAEAFFDLFIPDDPNFTYLQVWFRDRYGVAALGFMWSRTENGHSPIWQIQGGSYETSTPWAGENPGDAVIGGAGFRLGCTHDEEAGTARIYTEPYGGGARTYLIPATAVGGGWSNPDDALELYVQSDGDPAIAGGYLDNLTLITTDEVGPTHVAKVSGDLQRGALDVPLALPLVVNVQDALHVGVEGVSVDWVTVEEEGVVLSPTLTDVNGDAHTHWTPGVEGAVHAQALVAGLTGSPVDFTATGDVWTDAALTPGTVWEEGALTPGTVWESA